MPSPLLVRLLVGIALLLLGHGLQGILLGVRASSEGFADAVTGVIMAAFFAGFTAGSFIGPRLIEQAGHIRAFAALASLASIVTLSHALFVEEVLWVLLRAVHGFCFGVLVMVAESWLNAHATRETRGRVLAIYGTVFLGSWSASQLLLMVADPDGFRLFALVSILISASLIPLALGRAETSGGVSATRTGLRRLYEISPLGVAGAMLTGMAMNAFWTLGPVYVKALGLANQWNALFMSASLLGGAVLQWPLGTFSDRFDRRHAIVGAALVSMALCIVIALLGSYSAAVLIALAFVLGAASTPLYSLCIAHANDHVEQDEHVGAASALLIVYGIGAIIGPLAGGFLMSAAGPPALFGVVAAAFGGLAAFGIWRILVSDPVPMAEQDPFVAVPATTHMESDLDPRGVERSDREAAGESAQTD